MRRLAAVIVVVLAVSALAYLQVPRQVGPSSGTVNSPASTLSPAERKAEPKGPAQGEPGASALEVLPDPSLRDQVARVVRSMDETGRPPRGVVQGGRRDGPRGVFDNAQRRLPVRPYRYYTETDVWPRGPNGRGAERLVFGGAREVYYTPDHYRTFTRVR